MAITLSAINAFSVPQEAIAETIKNTTAHFKPKFCFIFGFRLYSVLTWVIFLISGSDAVYRVSCGCGAGYYSEPGVSQCTVCPAGHYCSGGDKFACPAGTSNSLTGSMNSFACTICPRERLRQGIIVNVELAPRAHSPCRDLPVVQSAPREHISPISDKANALPPLRDTMFPINAATLKLLAMQALRSLSVVRNHVIYVRQVSSKLKLGKCLVVSAALDSILPISAQRLAANVVHKVHKAVVLLTLVLHQPASNDICPAVIAKTPSKRSPSQLHADFCSISVPRRHWCKVLNGGMECVDTMNDLEMCGGCLEPGHAEDLTTGARDCSAIEGVGNVQCKQGKCEIGSCRKGFQVSTDGRTCVRVKLADIHKRLSHASTKSKGWEVSL
ncbi:related to GCC2 and GCC3 family protein-Laccaria bicolor [Lentinula edodes]|uniref:Related to GCC2 and GCC3 family protein-Laccaria bicolor n=1 Tax=Lentinula edodes TaxID=5353 RepID=A0A1Q3DZ37_LENED|nr:related to GCC2 and GCC3 family protein-Laccaria bicolor [Lentinula edodes]